MKTKAVEIGTIWGPVKPYDPNDPVQKALDKLKDISEVKLVYIACNVLSVIPLPEQVHPLSGIMSGEKITYIPLEMRVSSAENVEVVNFNLHPRYKISLLPIQAGDDIKVLLSYFIKHSGSEEFGSEALELEKKIGESYCKIDSCMDYEMPKELLLRPETRLKQLD